MPKEDEASENHCSPWRDHLTANPLKTGFKQLKKGKFINKRKARNRMVHWRCYRSRDAFSKQRGPEHA